MNNCALALSAGVQNFSVGLSAGRHFIDPVCQTINLSKALHGMGMKVAAISLLCQIPEVFKAMSAAYSNTPCPIHGKIGAASTKILFEVYDGKIPTYEQYLKFELKRIKAEKAKIKIESIKAYKTQFWDPKSNEPQTPISGIDFFDFIKARSREYGRLIKTEFGEGFTVEKPLKITDLTKEI